MFCEKIELTFQNWEISPKIPDFKLLLKNPRLQHRASIITGAFRAQAPPVASQQPSCVASGSHLCHLPEAVGTWASGLSLQVTVAYDYTPRLVSRHDPHSHALNPE